MNDRLAELRELQDDITATASRRPDRHGPCGCWSTRPGVARSAREAPEIDGIVHVGHDVLVGEFAAVEIVDALGPDLVAAGATVGDDGLMPVDPTLSPRGRTPSRSAACCCRR